MTNKELLQLHDDTCNACKAIMKQKNSDYTGGKGATDVFANFNASNDKELSVPNETVEDACDDIVNYAILAKAMLMEERSQIEQPVSKLPTGEEEVQAEKRMNVIGQNGNEGLHYKQTYAVGEGDMP